MTTPPIQPTLKPTHAHDLHGSASHDPLAKLWEMVLEDKRDLLVLVGYTVFVSILSLVTPLAAQALVNTIAAGVLIQPLIVLTVLVLIGLLFAAALRLIQLYLVEVIQQRIFAKIALRFAHRIPRLDATVHHSIYLPDWINRFFSTVTIQKTAGKIILDGPAAMLQIGIGLLLMGVYSPYLLAFDVGLILFMVFIVLLGKGALSTSIQESIAKYRVAHWLEELARCQFAFKFAGLPSIITTWADQQVVKYLQARRAHFKILIRQAFTMYLLYAFASAGVLAIGGWLVINREMTLGQLVASELIIVTVLSSLEKLVLLFEVYYDLVAGVDKVSSLMELPLESYHGESISMDPALHSRGIGVQVENITFSYQESLPLLQNFSFTVDPGDRVALVGANGAGKTTLVYLLCGLLTPAQGRVLLNGIDVRSIHPMDLRERVAHVDDSDSFIEGSLEDNIRMGRDHVTFSTLQWAMDMALLTPDLASLPNGLKMQVLSEGVNLSRGMRVKVLVARAILDKPSLLILDEVFQSLDERTKLQLLQNLWRVDNPWTIISITHDSEVLAQTNRITLMHQGSMVMSGSAKSLSQDPNNLFCQLFPYASYLIREGRMPV